MTDPNRAFWNGKNILITGITGFVGSWLAETLANECNANVSGLIRRQANPNNANIQSLLNDNKINLIRGDLHDLGSLINALSESKAEIVFHLASQSFVPHSFASPYETYLTNVMGTLNVLNAIKSVDTNIKMHFAGSSEEFGLVISNDEHYRKMLQKYKVIFPSPKFDGNGKAISEIPINENNPLRTVGTSPYGSSKRVGEDLCRTYNSCYNMNVITTRAFNHTGPRRGSEFVTSEITRQVAQGIKYGRKEIVLGNLESVRDFSDVRDIIKGYMLLMEKGIPGNVYILCSGVGRTIKEVMELAVEVGKEKFNLKHDMKYKLDSARLRPTDLPILIGDASNTKKIIGWKPEIPFKKTIEDMIQFYLNRI